MKYAQPLRETLRGRAPNLVGLCVRQDVGGYPAALLTTSLTQAGGYHPRFPALFHRVSVPFLHVPSVAQSVSQRCEMFTAEDDIKVLHPKLMALIEHEKRICGCVMKAVKEAARKAAVSEHWVRRVIGRYGKVHVQLFQARNVFKAYVSMKRAELREKRDAKKAARIFTAENQPKTELRA